LLSKKTYSNTPDYHEMSLMFSEFAQSIEKVHNIKINRYDDNDIFAHNYPLLANFSTYHADNSKDFMEHAIKYINLVDTTKV